MIDNRVIQIAKIQASLFQYSCAKNECASSFFIKQFCNSEVAKRMSDISFLFSSEDVPYLYESLRKEKKLNIGKTIYEEQVMYWIGYLLAVMTYSKNMSPKQIYKIIQPRDLFVAYEAYHSLDIEDAANRIYESRMVTNKNDLELFKSTRKV